VVEPRQVHVSVLGGFGLRLRDGTRPLLSAGSQRLVALLALRGRAVARDVAAGTLWPEASTHHAGSSLRSAVARLCRVARDVIEVNGSDLRLMPGVAVDLVQSRRLAARVLDPRRPAFDVDAALSTLPKDVLPDWYDEWLIAERECWRQLRLHSLETLAERLATAGRFADAVTAALAAVHAEPLRESARRALVRVHLAEGNQSEARREYERFRALLLAELGVEPTAQLTSLLYVHPS
jgi:DNA-binding SARP family transcriptional activator